MILRVALDVPLPKLFDYRADDASRADIGLRVLVPFGRKKLVGLIVDTALDSEIPAPRLRAAEKILRDVTPLTREWLQLVKFASGYYQRPLGEVVAAALPPRLRRARGIPEAPGTFAITPAGAEALAAMPARQRRLRALLTRLAQGPGTQVELAACVRGARSLVARGLDAGWIAAVEPARPDARFEHALELTSEQE